MPRPTPAKPGRKDPCEQLLETLRDRFEKNRRRHEGMAWDEVKVRLTSGRLRSLSEMERTGGEPDVIGLEDGKVLFVDCSAQSPAGRRSLCYDDAALEARKEHKPRGSALHMAKAMGTELLGEDEYRRLQTLGEFDTTTSSWIMTPPGIRKRGGALFCDRRYGAVFTYHNGAESYYAARGFRALLRV